MSAAVDKALAWYDAHKHDGTPEVAVVRDLLSEHADLLVRCARYEMALGTLPGEVGPVAQAAALEMFHGGRGAQS